MTLLDNLTGPMIYEVMTDCTLLVRTGESYPDGMGGHTDIYSEGAKFKAFVRQDVIKQDVTGQQQVLSEHFTVIVHSNMRLKYHELFRRESDGQVFRLMSNTTDAAAPGFSSVGLAKASCERWEL